jgi:hypothetical protein
MKGNLGAAASALFLLAIAALPATAQTTAPAAGAPAATPAPAAATPPAAKVKKPRKAKAAKKDEAAPAAGTAAAAPAPAAAGAPAAAKPAAKKQTPGQIAAHERMKKCGAEWKEEKAAGKVAKDMTWPKYWSDCNKRMKGQGA